jgi:hypothetical protein
MDTPSSPRVRHCTRRWGRLKIPAQTLKHWRMIRTDAPISRWTYLESWTQLWITSKTALGTISRLRLDNHYTRIGHHKSIASMVPYSGAAPSPSTTLPMKTHRLRLLCQLACALALRALPVLPAAVHGQTYKVVDQITVDSGIVDFISVDPVNRRLYGFGAKVIDIDRDSIVGELPRAGHGFALAPELARGVARNGLIFDLKSLQVITKLPIRGDISTFDPITGRAFIFSDSGTVVDVQNASIVRTIPLPGKPESAVADRAGRIFVNIVDRNSLLVIDTRSLTTTTRSWEPCEGPQGLAIDLHSQRLFASCGNRMVAVMDAVSGRLIATVPVGAGADEIAFDAPKQLVLNPNGDGTVTVIRPAGSSRYVAAGTSRIPDSGPAVTIDSVSHRAFFYHVDGKKLTVLVAALSSPRSESNGPQ